MGEHNERREAASVDERGLRPPAAYSIRDGGTGVLALEGELDLAAAPALRKRVDEFDGASLVLDFARVTFIDSAVLKELLRARAELAEQGSPARAGGRPGAGAAAARPHADVRAVRGRAGRRQRAQAAERLTGTGRGGAAGSDWELAPAHSHWNPACSMSLPAEAASTVATVRPVAGACRRRRDEPERGPRAGAARAREQLADRVAQPAALGTAAAAPARRRTARGSSSRPSRGRSASRARTSPPRARAPRRTRSGLRPRALIAVAASSAPYALVSAA